MRSILGSCSGLVLVAAAALAMSAQTAIPTTAERLPLPVKPGPLRKIVAAGNDVYLLDHRNHRLLVRRGNSSFSQLGQIGNGKGDLYQPYDLTVDRNGRVVVKDGGNRRIQILDSRGKFVSAFPDVPKSLGLAVTNNGDILLGQPQLGQLITAYDEKGKRKKSFGSLILPSELFGPSHKKFDATHKHAFNRVLMTTDDKGNIWAALVHAPLLLKFDSHGHLVSKKRLNYPELKPVVDGVWEPTPPRQWMSVNLDGIQLTMVNRDIVFDPRTQTVLLLLGNDSVVAYDTTGRERYAYRLDNKFGALQSVTVGGDGQILASVFGSPAMYRFGTTRK
jgi:hypothetical protein